jgi:hypothetical protein
VVAGDLEKSFSFLFLFNLSPFGRGSAAGGLTKEKDKEER